MSWTTMSANYSYISDKLPYQLPPKLALEHTLGVLAHQQTAHQQEFEPLVSLIVVRDGRAKALITRLHGADGSNNDADFYQSLTGAHQPVAARKMLKSLNAYERRFVLGNGVPLGGKYTTSPMAIRYEWCSEPRDVTDYLSVDVQPDSVMHYNLFFDYLLP
ncbi:MAG TPA: hypothetical protein VLE93_00550 [Candidatus Saccharimonadales bacterium]|nr:hypothetical protein [Candidatus Saccharimonadales bacterium]